jgi:hypothetical protein
MALALLTFPIFFFFCNTLVASATLLSISDAELAYTTNTMRPCCDVS